MTPLSTVSIVIPSFNQGEFVERTIDSILTNRIKAEIIVMDGGSTDSTVAVLKRRQSDLACWRSEPDHGQGDAVNKALRIAQGDIVGWINSDDVYLPGTIDRVLQEFRRRPDADVIHGDRLMIDEDDGVIGWSAPGSFKPHHRGYNVCNETAFWRRGRAAGLELNPSLRFAMDLEWFSRLYSQGLQFHYLPRFLGGFRCYARNKSSTIPDVGYEETRREWRKIFNNECWKVNPPRGKLKHISAGLLDPKHCLVPYLYRRFWLGRRGLLTRLE